MSDPKEILVIDDDAIMRDLIVDWLEGAGYSVRKATDCNSACTALERGPALVVSEDRKSTRLNSSH